MGRPLHLPLPVAFDFAWAVRFLSARAVPALELVRDREYSRVVWPVALEAAGLRVRRTRPVVLHARYSPPTRESAARLEVRSVPAMPPDALRWAATRLFDLDADVAAFHRQVAGDPVLGPLMRRERLGIRLPQLLDPFECLVRAIVGQQVSVPAATTMTGRLVRLLGTPARGAGDDGSREPRLAFPRPADLAGAGTRRLRDLGFTRSKTATLLGVADAAARGALDLEKLRRSDGPGIEAALTALPGIGPWTAAYVRLRAFGDRDAFPVADLGVIKALEALGVARSQVAVVAERWRPWRGYAVLHLWRSLEAGA